MGIYKLSSQFTDYVISRSTNPAKILEQVGNALSELGYSGIATFHEANELDQVSPEDRISDDEMMELVMGDPKEKAKFLNQMYEVLRGLESTGKIDMVTRKLIDSFLNNIWKPIKIEEPSGTVIRRRKPGESNTPKTDTDITIRENTPSWQRQEDRMAWLLDRNKSAGQNISGMLFIKAGIIEKVPNILERKTKLSERKYSWIKII
jgi:hypothetical protein